MHTDLQIVGSEGAEDLWRYIQAWGARQRETVVQILATDGVLHQPANQNQDPRQQKQHTAFEETPLSSHLCLDLTSL